MNIEEFVRGLLKCYEPNEADAICSANCVDDVLSRTNAKYFLCRDMVLEAFKKSDDVRDLLEGLLAESRNPNRVYYFLSEEGVLSCCLEDLTKMKLLLDLGVDPNPPNCLSLDSMDPCALMDAVGSGNLKAAELLLEYGANPDTSDPYETLVGKAAGRGDIDMIGLLARYGADLDLDNNIKGRYSMPLRIALEKGHFRTARYLLSLGASPDLVSFESSYSQQRFDVDRLPEDLRRVFIGSSKELFPFGDYSRMLPHPGSISAGDRIFARIEDMASVQSENPFVYAWAKRTYDECRRVGGLPLFVKNAKLDLRHSVLLYWLYVNYCNETDWISGMNRGPAGSYYTAREHNFWVKIPNAARAIRWEGYFKETLIDYEVVECDLNLEDDIGAIVDGMDVRIQTDESGDKEHPVYGSVLWNEYDETMAYLSDAVSQRLFSLGGEMRGRVLRAPTNGAKTVQVAIFPV